MCITIHQSISIYMIKIGTITNSSVLQIGTTGSIEAQSDIHHAIELTGDDEFKIPLGEISSYIVQLAHPAQ